LTFEIGRLRFPFEFDGRLRFPFEFVGRLRFPFEFELDLDLILGIWMF
jgi:hypothetical protein